MKFIWKYTLEITDEQTIKMPVGLKILSAQLQANAVCIWALCDAEQRMEQRHFVIIGTGHPVPAFRLTYIATIQQECLVWHLFERETKTIGV